MFKKFLPFKLACQSHQQNGTLIPKPAINKLTIAIGNVEVTHEYFPKHLCMKTARMKEDRTRRQAE